MPPNRKSTKNKAPSPSKHFTSDPTGFNYWDILIGQGDYYNPDFKCNGQKTKRPGYVTNVITDLALDWLENKRDKDKPFCLLLHHKAPHRVWDPDTCDLDLYNDRTYPLPATFYDNYEGRQASAKQKMSIIKDMDIVYDLKMADKENENSLEQMARKMGKGGSVAHVAIAKRTMGQALRPHYQEV